jgi:glycosyltransferase involved in cell wall biosynthesis
MRICTIVARNYLAYARVLAESFNEHHRDGECIVLVIDDVAGDVDPANEPFTVMRPDELEIERFAGMAGMYDVTELATAVKPWLLEQLLRDADQPVAYFDPDIRFYAPVERIDRLAREHELVLTPHITEPIPEDGKQPGELDLMASGVYNLGFVAMAPGERTQELLEWWQRRLRYDCVIDHALGYFVDQRWFDLVPNTFAGTALMRDPGMNVAYWNLHGREISRDEHGGWLVNGEPLRFYHFSGFNPDEPHLLSKHQTRTRLSEHPALAQLCGEFAELVRSHRRPGEGKVAYAWDELGDGRRWDRRLRRLYREGERVGAFSESPFEEVGAKEFFDWLNEPALETASPVPVSRFWFDVYRERVDLQNVFPDLSSDGPEFLRWIEGFGHEMGDVRGLMPPRMDDEPPAGPGAEDGAEDGVAVANERHAEDLDRAALEQPEPLGVNVAGFLQSELGIGEAARELIAGLDAVRVPLLPLHGSWRPSSRQEHAYAMLGTDAAAFGINIVCVNADVLADWAKAAGERFFAGRYTIGFWWWEVHAFPPEWLDAFDLVDEVWVATQHVADSIASVSSVPVTKVTMPISPPTVARHTRAELGLPEGFLFLFVFDHHSVFERKNPLATIEAFKRAFPPGSGASLVVKSINHEFHPHAHERLLDAANEHPDVQIIDCYVSGLEKNSMIASADCYVSLHRAEGFGLTMAEAMLLGKPVIATRYGGNLDFMSDRDSWLVDCEMTPIGSGQAPYPANGEWAAPDIDQAARHMREIFTDPPAARRRALRGAERLRAQHSPAAAGRSMRDRLEHIHARRAQLAGPPAQTAPGADLARLHDLVQSGPRAPLRSPLGPLGRVLRRVVLRLIKPFTVHQQAINSELLAAAEALSGEPASRRRAERDAQLQGARQAAAQLAESRRQAHATEQLAGELDRLREAAPSAADALAAGTGSPGEQDAGASAAEELREQAPLDAPRFAGRGS